MKCFTLKVIDIFNFRTLVLCSRGDRVPDMYWEKKNGELASGDDISVLTVSLKEALAITTCNISQKSDIEM